VFNSSSALVCDEAPKIAAEAAGLRYVSDAAPGIRRKPAGKGFSYHKPDGSKVGDDATLARIRSLAIPPAWTEVWICPSPSGHIQATGRDARQRKQYKYHTQFREQREADKFDHLIAFAKALPRIRKRVHADLALRGLPREKVMATVVNLLELTLIRVGNEDYARQNKSYGLTTLKNRHVVVSGAEIRFRFTGKSGKQWMLKVRDRRVARIVKSCQELPGQDLLQYLDETGSVQTVTSSDVNDYLRAISGEDITAKDFRTWFGTVLAALVLNGMENAETAAAAKMNLRNAVAQVASRLGNTPTICRKCYIHPQIMERYLGREFTLDVAPPSRARAWFSSEEAAVLAFLRSKPGGKIKAAA
jgi:DNA topoisomerase-1